MDTWRHNRFLDYRERHVYFGRHKPLLDYPAFVVADDEHIALNRAGESRSDEDEQRFAELTALLMRD